MANADTATAALPDAQEEDRKPLAAAADGSLAPKQPAVFDPFPVCADGLGAANAAALYGQFCGGKEGADEDAGFGAADYSCVLDVSENLGYGESSSNSSNWNSAPEASNALEGEALHWASESKVEPFAGYAGDEDDKFALPCHGQQEHSMAHFDFNLEYF